MNEKLQAVIGRMQHQIVALTAERDGAREQRDTARAELAAVTEERDGARKNYQFMVNRAMDESLDGYRELGERAANAENEADRLRAELAAAEARIDEIRDIFDRWAVPVGEQTTEFCQGANAIIDQISPCLEYPIPHHAAGEPAGGTGEGCPTCKGTHMVSGTHGLDACPVCRPEPAMGEGDDKPVSYYAECPHDPGSICVDLDENNHCEMADECGEPDLHCDFRPAQHGEGGA